MSAWLEKILANKTIRAIVVVASLAFGAGVSWAVARAQAVEVERRLDQHIQESRSHPKELEALRLEMTELRAEVRNHGALLKEVRDDVKSLAGRK